MSGRFPILLTLSCALACLGADETNAPPTYRDIDGPPHHYVFELYALDGPLEVPAVGASPAETRAAILAAMSGKVRGKAAMVGLFKRGT